MCEAGGKSEMGMCVYIEEMAKNQVVCKLANDKRP